MLFIYHRWTFPQASWRGIPKLSHLLPENVFIGDFQRKYVIPVLLSPYHIDGWLLNLRGKWFRMLLYEELCTKNRANTSNYIPQIVWDVITCSCHSYLLLAHNSSYMLSNYCFQQNFTSAKVSQWHFNGILRNVNVQHFKQYNYPGTKWDTSVIIQDIHSWVETWQHKCRWLNCQRGMFWTQE